MMSIRLLSAQTFFQFVLVLLVTIGVAACGGGGGNSSAKPTAVPTSEPTPTPEPDTTPADFTLSLPQATYERGAVATTEQVTITEIDTLTDISISSGGEYSIDSGSFTSTAGQIANNQTVVARATAGGNFGDEFVISLTVGTLTRSFTVSTEAEDDEPDTFDIPDSTGLLPGETIITGVITVSGINNPVDVAITRGKYSIDGGDYVASGGTVENGQQITVQVDAPAAAGAIESITLTVGTGSDTFQLATINDTTPPSTEIYFPPPFSLTTDETIKVRGVATDDYSVISSIAVNGVEAVATSNNFATWEAEIPLTQGLINEINVIASDISENSTIESEALLARVERRVDVKGAFPDEENGGEGYDVAYFPGDSDKLLVGRGAYLYTLDLVTGGVERIVVDHPYEGVFTYVALTVSPDSRVFPSSSASGILAELDLNSAVMRDISSFGLDVTVGPSVVSETGDTLFVANGTSLELLEINIETGSSTVISSNSFPNSENPFTSNLYGLVIDDASEFAYVTGGLPMNNDWTIWKVNLTNGQREIFSNSTFPDGVNLPEGTTSLHGLASPLVLDAKRGRLLLGMPSNGANIVAVNLNSESGPLGGRTLLADATKNTGEGVIYYSGITLDENKDIAFLSTFLGNGGVYAGGHIAVMDLTTNNIVYISKASD